MNNQLLGDIVVYENLKTQGFRGYYPYFIDEIGLWPD